MEIKELIVNIIGIIYLVIFVLYYANSYLYYKSQGNKNKKN
jgi:hypothetical protein